MEIRTCEEYVLAKLARLQDEYDEALDSLQEAHRENDKVRRELAQDEEIIVYQAETREKLETELAEAKERIRSLEATCSDFARELDKLRRKAGDDDQ